MTYAFLLRDTSDGQRLGSAIAAVLSVPVESVDVAEYGNNDRHWEAPVTCTVTSIGCELCQQILIYVADETIEQISLEDAATRLAEQLGSPAAYELMRPDVYWLADPDGRRSRARIDDDEDDGDLVLFRVVAVDQPVAGAPDLPLGRSPRSSADADADQRPISRLAGL